jgi:phosphoribosyl 1,2-cyclic phosphodiesterase
MNNPALKSNISTPAVVTVCVLGSGSKGNSVFLQAGSTKLLIDAGLSYRQLSMRLATIGVEPSEIEHIFITHEHVDHISGLKIFTKTHPVELHLNSSTYIQTARRIHKSAAIHVFDGVFSIGDIIINPFTIPHDASDPVGYTITYHNIKVSIATDLGHGSPEVIEQIKHSHAVILEANHDEAMLWNGRYTWPLKQRIAGPSGHLSNTQAAHLLKQVYHPDLQYVVLAHLSQENNNPKLAFNAVFEYLRETMGFQNTQVLLTHQEQSTPIIRL